MNLLWIMADQHRADCLGYMGHTVVQTPHLDRLASEGAVFEQAFCQSPVCMASRASLMTGRYPEAVRVRGMGLLPPQETTLSELLRRGGWRTGAFGKVHLTPEQYTLETLKSDVPTLDWRQFGEAAVLAPPVDDPCKENYGFESYEGCEDILQGHFRAWLGREAPELLEQRPQRVPLAGAPGDLWVSPYPSAYHQTTYIAKRTETFIRQQQRGRPWMAFCSFVAPHHPFEAPAEQIARYDEKAVPLPKAKGGVDGRFIPQPQVDALGEADRLSVEVRRRIVLHYLASISLIDDNVGRLVEALRDVGQLDETVIVYVADHGEFLGNHGLLRKPSLHYDETLRVPLMICGPGVEKGRRVSGLVELVDVYPTLAGLLGIETNAGVQGADWSAALGSGAMVGKEAINSSMFDMAPLVAGKPHGPYGACVTLRTAQWKLNLYPSAGRQYGQLFHLAEDPQESHNLYGEAAWAGVREEMTWHLVRRQHIQADSLPLRLTQY